MYIFSLDHSHSSIPSSAKLYTPLPLRCPIASIANPAVLVPILAVPVPVVILVVDGAVVVPEATELVGVVVRQLVAVAGSKDGGSAYGSAGLGQGFVGRVAFADLAKGRGELLVTDVDVVVHVYGGEEEGVCGGGGCSCEDEEDGMEHFLFGGVGSGGLVSWLESLSLEKGGGRDLLGLLG